MAETARWCAESEKGTHYIDNAAFRPGDENAAKGLNEAGFDSNLIVILHICMGNGANIDICVEFINERLDVQPTFYVRVPAST